MGTANESAACKGCGRYPHLSWIRYADWGGFCAGCSSRRATEDDEPVEQAEEAEKPDGGVDGQDSREPEADYWDSLFGEDFAADKKEHGRAAADSESDARADCGVE